MKKNKNVNKKKIWPKWLCFGIFIFLSSLILVESALPGELSGKQSALVSNVLRNFINRVGKGAPEEAVYPTSMSFSSPQTVIIGTSGRFEVKLERDDKKIINRNKIIFSVDEENKDKVNIVQKGNVAWVEVICESKDVGSEVTLTAKAESKDKNGLSITARFTITERSAPNQFEATIDGEPISKYDSEENSLHIQKGTTKTIDILINAPAKKDEANYELKQERYFDPKKLIFESSNDKVATVNEYGVILGIGGGSAEIFIKKDGDSSDAKPRSFHVKVEDFDAVKPTGITCEKSITRYVYDLDNDDPKNGFIFHTSLNAKITKKDASDKGIYYKVEDELIARVDKNGNVFGYKKAGRTTVWAIAKADENIKASCEVIATKAKGEKIVVEETNIILGLNEQSTITPKIEPKVAYNTQIVVSDFDKSIIDAKSDGTIIHVTGVGIGKSKLRLSLETDPTVFVDVNYEIKKPLVVKEHQKDSFQNFVRKSAGHFTLFMLTGVFAFLTLFFFFKDKFPLWLMMIISSLGGIALAGTSEFFQLITRDRGPSLIDVGIDSLGFILSSIFLMGLFYIIFAIQKAVKKRKTADKNKEK